MKNKVIELERFIASCIVLLYHLKIVKSGWIFVEFFFILTGYFLTKHMENRKNEPDLDSTWYPLKYTFKKYINVFPYTAVSIVAMWFYYAKAWNLSGTGIIKWLFYLPCELLLIGGSGMLPYGYVFYESITTPRMMNVLLWYVSSMLIVMPIAFYLLKNHKKFRGLLCTVVPAILYGFLIMKDGRVNGWHDESFGFIYCNIRALAGILLGAGTWHLSNWWKLRKYTQIGKIFLTICELLSFMAVVIISSITYAPYDCLEIALFVLSLSLTNSGVTYSSSVKCNLFNLLGSWSLAIYCLHKPIINFCTGHFGAYDVLIISLITIVLSALYTWIIDRVRELYKPYKTKTKKIFIE